MAATWYPDEEEIKRFWFGLLFRLGLNFFYFSQSLTAVFTLAQMLCFSCEKSAQVSWMYKITTA